MLPIMEIENGIIEQIAAAKLPYSATAMNVLKKRMLLMVGPVAMDEWLDSKDFVCAE